MKFSLLVIDTITEGKILKKRPKFYDLLVKAYKKNGNLSLIPPLQRLTTSIRLCFKQDTTQSI